MDRSAAGVRQKWRQLCLENGGDSMMETLGLQFKDKIYDDMKTDEHTDERMEALREQELRTKRRKKGLFSFLKRKK